MKDGRLTVEFHNPNTKEATARLLARVFIEASRARSRHTLREVTGGEHAERFARPGT